MPPNIPEVVELDAVLDALDEPTSSDVYYAADPYSAHAVAAVAAKHALSGGGGGGSFNGGTITEPLSIEATGTAAILFSIIGPAALNNHLLLINNADGWGWRVGASGATDFSIFDDANPALSIYSEGNGGILKLSNADGDVFVISPAGALTVAPGGDIALEVGTDGSVTLAGSLEGFTSLVPGGTPFEFPAEPVVQDVVDFLVALGSATQAAP